MPKHAMKGVPDIILIKQPSGRFIGLEVKTDTGRLSPEQIEFRNHSEKAGGWYYVVRSIDDVQRLGL
jgi:VRR-NUC domain